MKKIFSGCLVIILLIAGGLVYWFWEDIAYWWGDDDYAYYELPEDCYEDEYYDYEDKLCYIDEEFDDDLLTLFFDLADEVLVSLDGDFEDFESTLENAIITYEIDGNLIVNPEEVSISDDLLAYQEDTDSHQKIWVYYANLIPPNHRTNLTQFVIFTDGQEEVMAAVEQDVNDPEKWVLAVDIVDAENPQELTYTLIHEFGHLLTLNANQVDPDEDIFEDPENDEIYEEAVEACPQYFPGEGCSLPNSYIHLFVERFWFDLFDEWDEINYVEDDDEYYAMLDEFYYAHQDQFVTDYAATNPGEDIAESWTHFVLQPKPEGDTVSEQKVLFFYEFPELVELREKIVARTFSRLRRP
ncbi:MAG: hypothetical protein ISR58_22515 [Anaerolineales bacterium]|nr:hypothetical protein [Chloroflexota bacterium]MBL6983970.1 hypothetical protein [Anaerolineales bacterium]